MDLFCSLSPRTIHATRRVYQIAMISLAIISIVAALGLVVNTIVIFVKNRGKFRKWRWHALKSIAAGLLVFLMIRSLHPVVFPPLCQQHLLAAATGLHPTGTESLDLEFDVKVFSKFHIPTTGRGKICANEHRENAFYRPQCLPVLTFPTNSSTPWTQILRFRLEPQDRQSVDFLKLGSEILLTHNDIYFGVPESCRGGHSICSVPVDVLSAVQAYFRRGLGDRTDLLGLKESPILRTAVFGSKGSGKTQFVYNILTAFSPILQVAIDSANVKRHQTNHIVRYSLQNPPPLSQIEILDTWGYETDWPMSERLSYFKMLVLGGFEFRSLEELHMMALSRSDSNDRLNFDRRFEEFQKTTAKNSEDLMEPDERGYDRKVDMVFGVLSCTDGTSPQILETCTMIRDLKNSIDPGLILKFFVYEDCGKDTSTVRNSLEKAVGRNNMGTYRGYISYSGVDKEVELDVEYVKMMHDFLVQKSVPFQTRAGPDQVCIRGVISRGCNAGNEMKLSGVFLLWLMVLGWGIAFAGTFVYLFYKDYFQWSLRKWRKHNFSEEDETDIAVAILECRELAKKTDDINNREGIEELRSFKRRCDEEFVREVSKALKDRRPGTIQPELLPKVRQVHLAATMLKDKRKAVVETGDQDVDRRDPPDEPKLDSDDEDSSDW